MQAMSLMRAEEYRACLEAVDIDVLIGRGCKLVLLDRDNTVVSRETGEMGTAVQAWVARALASGLEICLISNNIFSSQVQRTAEVLGVPYISGAFKPLPFALSAARKRSGVRKDQAWVIGDQSFTDCLAAHLAGLRCIQVPPLSEHDLPYTKVLRRVEKRLLREVDFDSATGQSEQCNR